jgi:hypothetical protein
MHRFTKKNKNIGRVLCLTYVILLVQAAVWLSYGESLFEVGQLEEAERAYQQVTFCSYQEVTF